MSISHSQVYIPPSERLDRSVDRVNGQVLLVFDTTDAACSAAILRGLSAKLGLVRNWYKSTDTQTSDQEGLRPVWWHLRLSTPPPIAEVSDREVVRGIPVIEELCFLKTEAREHNPCRDQCSY